MSDTSTATEAQASQAASSDTAKAPAPKLAARPKRQAPKRNDVVWSVPSGSEHLLGIWVCQWTFLAAALPGGRLAGSGVVLKSFDSYLGALEFWTEKRDPDVAPLHEQ